MPMHNEENEFEVVFELDDEDSSLEFVLDEEDTDNFLPGSSVYLEKSEDEKEESQERDWENDKDHSYFLVYMAKKLDEVPSWSGTTTVGCEKAISYLRKLDKELSDAIRSDEDNVIDEQEAEQIRDTIYKYVSNLEDAYDDLMKKYEKKAHVKLNKKVVARIKDGQDIQYFASVASSSGEETLLKVELVEPTDSQVQSFISGSDGMNKSASAGVVLFEDPFLHSITRLLIQGHITNGKDLSEMYAELKEKYDFTPREELSIQELLYQKGFPLIKDLGRMGEDGVRPQDGLGFEHHTEYYS